MFNFMTNLVSLGYWGAMFAAGGALALGMAFAPWARVLPRSARLLGAFGGIALAAFAGGVLHGQSPGKKELRELQAAVTAAQARSRELSAQAQARLIKIQQLEGIADEYAEELAAGDSVACVADTAYTERLQRILEQRSQ